MKGKIVRYSKDHSHVYVYSETAGTWKCVGCRLGGNWDRCTAGTQDLPRGTKFDGEVTLNQAEENRWEMV